MQAGWLTDRLAVSNQNQPQVRWRATNWRFCLGLIVGLVVAALAATQPISAIAAPANVPGVLTQPAQPPLATLLPVRSLPLACTPSRCGCRNGRRTICTRDCRRDIVCTCRGNSYVCRKRRTRSR